MTSSQDRRLHWRATGPAGGYFHSFAFDGLGRTFAGSDDSGGVWASDDDGLTWRLATGAFTNACGWHVTVSPHDSRVVYAADHYGRQPLLVSTDRGETWEVRGTELPKEARRFGVVLVDEADPDRLWVGTGMAERVGSGIMASDDGGRTWRQSAFDGNNVTELAQIGSVLYAGISGGDERATPGLFASADGGASWDQVATLPGGAVTTMAVEGKTLYVGAPGAEGSLHRSDDGGHTWESLGLVGTVLWDVAAAGDLLVVGSLLGGQGVLRSHDGGRTWAAAEGLESYPVMGMGRNPHTGTVLASTFTNCGVYRSTDDGATFAPSIEGLNATFIVEVGAGRGRVFAAMLGTYEVVPDANVNALTVTEDGGQTWRRTGGVAAHGLTVAADDAGRVLLGTFRQGAWLSEDDGESFERIEALGADTVVQGVSFGPDGVALASVGAITDDGMSVRLARSADGGRTWETAAPGLQANTTAFSDDGHAWAAGTTGVAHSADGGASWRLLSEQPSRAVLPEPGGTALVGTVDGAVRRLRAGDGGETLAQLVAPEASFGIYAIVRSGDALFAGVGGAEGDDRLGGMFVSYDDGRTWSAAADGLSNDHVWGMDVDASGAVYAGTYAGSVFRLEQS
jgi:hypothetical protein